MNIAQRFTYAIECFSEEQNRAANWPVVLAGFGAERVIGRNDLYMFRDGSMVALSSGGPVEYIGGIA